MPFVNPRAPFFSGARHFSPEDGPVLIDEERARALVAAGLAEIMAPVDRFEAAAEESVNVLIEAGLIEAEDETETEPNTAEDETEIEPNTAEDETEIEPNSAVDHAPAVAERSTARNHRKRK